MGSMIELLSGDGTSIDAYHVDAQGERVGGLVLIMEIFGVTDHIKSLCDKFSEQGYEVISPALYDRLEKNFQCDYSPASIESALELRDGNSYANTVLDCQAAINQLVEKGPVYITGFCYGGSVTWAAACRCSGLTAASSYYGRQIIDFNDETPLCPIILHFGEHDESIPMDLVRAIDAAHDDVPVYIYDAGHGFQSDRPTHYNDAAAHLAWDRTLELFAKYR